MSLTCEASAPGGRSFFEPLWEELAASSWTVVNNTQQMHTSSQLPLLGLFSNVNLPYELDRDATKVPSLEEMARKAVQLLTATDRGFFLLVECAQETCIAWDANAMRMRLQDAHGMRTGCARDAHGMCTGCV